MATNGTAVQTVRANTELNNAGQPKAEDNRITILLEPDTFELMAKAYKMQADVENESKFQAEFIRKAILQTTKTVASKAVNDWTRAVDKYSQEHPKMDRVTCEVEACASKTNRELKKLAEVAIQVKKTL